MTYLSVCSGIEAATVAWEPLGFAEIEPFPYELLKQKYPNVKNYGDITQYEKDIEEDLQKAIEVIEEEIKALEDCIEDIKKRYS